jgi:hypothetical protein
MNGFISPQSILKFLNVDGSHKLQKDFLARKKYLCIDPSI